MHYYCTILKYMLYLCWQQVSDKPTQDNNHANYRHRLSWLSLERRNINITLLMAGRGKTLIKIVI